MPKLDLLSDRAKMAKVMEDRSVMYKETWVKDLRPLPFAVLYMIHNLPDDLRGNEMLYLDRLHHVPWLSDPEMCDGTIWAALSVAIESSCPKQALAKTVGYPWWSPEDDRYWLGQDLRHDLTGARNQPIVTGDLDDPEVYHEAVAWMRSAIDGAAKQMTFAEF